MLNRTSQTELPEVPGAGPDGALLSELRLSRAIIDSAPGVFYLFDASGRFLRWNRNLERVSEYDAEAVARMHPLDFFGEAARPRVAAAIARVLIDGAACVEAPLLTRGGRTIPYRFSGRRTEFEGTACVVGFGMDISEHVRISEELDRHRNRLETLIERRTRELEKVILQLAERKAFIRTLTENLPFLVSYWDRNQRCLFANHAYRVWFDKTAQDPVGSLLPEVVGRDVYEMIRANIEGAINGDAQTFCRELTRADGQRAHMLVQHLPDRLGDEVVGIFIVLTDISAHRDTELELEASRRQLRQLIERQEQLREQELHHLARELHDELGQHLTGMHYAVEALRFSGWPSPKQAEEVALDLKQQLDQTMAIVRRIVVSLRPTSLDNGLLPALESLATEFLARTGIDCRLSVQGNLPFLSNVRSTTVFRIAQESLTNVARHAGARTASMRLFVEPRRLWLIVQDDGCGFVFDPGSMPMGVGLFGMKERAQLVGASLMIESAPGMGTRIELELPLAEEEEDA